MAGEWRVAYAAVQVPMLAGFDASACRWQQLLAVAARRRAADRGGGDRHRAGGPAARALGASPPACLQLALGARPQRHARICRRPGVAQRRAAPDKTHQRGAVVADAPRPRRSRSRRQDASMRRSRWPAPGTGADETKHFKFIGTTGTGKSTAIQEILAAALARGDRAVIADPDGGYLRRFYDPDRGDVVLNPFDERSVKWDLFAEIRNAYDVEQLARSLIPDHEGADRSWRGYARTFFTAVTRQAHEAGVSDVGELYRLLVVADTRNCAPGARHAGAAVPGRAQRPHVRFDPLGDQLGGRRARTRRAADGRRISRCANGSARRRPGVLVHSLPGRQIAALRSTISAWMRLAIFEAMDRDDEPIESRAAATVVRGR